MNQLLRIGNTVRAERGGLDYRIQRFLGGGGQGEVYAAEAAGQQMALKWYFPETQWATPDQRRRLEQLLDRGAPTNRFLWPLDLASAPGVPGFGYLMALRQPNYHGITDLLTKRCDPSFKVLAKAGLLLADSFLTLHAQGLSYSDISWGNVFFAPDTGEILICDNDNVTVNGEAGPYGTQRFMAPEIVRGEAMSSTTTDLYSLAVLLFYMFIVHHPLDGAQEAAIKCFDAPAMNKIYGTSPIFIFDPVSLTNRPVPGLHDNALELWPILPRFFQELFIRSFTKGLHDPENGRVRESEWRKGLARLLDSIVYCAKCEVENFNDDDRVREQGQPGQCWKCDRPLVLPPRIGFGRWTVMLNHDGELFPHHLDPNCGKYDFAPVAMVGRHPTNENVWGLKNLSQASWSVVRPDGSVQIVDPGRSVTLADGLRVQFGKVEGTIQAGTA